MKRRTFLALVPGGLLAAPPAAEGQQAGKVRRVGILSVGAAPSAEEVARSPFLAGAERSRLDHGAEHRLSSPGMPRANPIGCPLWRLSSSG